MKIELEAIAFVANERTAQEDDKWGCVVSTIQLAENIPTEALDGVDAFSHLEVLFYMNNVPDEKAIARTRHPRNLETLPRIGIYAQRNKSRPNKLGLTTVEFVSRVGRSLIVKRLDAINGTPVLDIKPVMKGFEPKSEIIEPAWTEVIMESYWYCNEDK